jgi:fructokinase
VLGEVLWDLLPTGKVLGGAPANFASHAHAMGAAVHLISRVGNDPLGTEALQRLEARGLSTRFVGIDATLLTGTVSVRFEGGEPHYIIHEGVAWDSIRVDEPMLAAMCEADAVCFGTLAQRSHVSRESIWKLLAAAPMQALRVLDINLRQQFYSRSIIEASLGFANFLKLNEAELPVLGEMFGLKGSVQERLEALIRQFDLSGVAYTMGAAGSVVAFNGTWSGLPAVPTRVRDTVGAGDAFTAALIVGLLAKRPLPAVHDSASHVAAEVCSHDGPVQEK